MRLSEGFLTAHLSVCAWIGRQVVIHLLPPRFNRFAQLRCYHRKRRVKPFQKRNSHDHILPSGACGTSSLSATHPPALLGNIVISIFKHILLCPSHWTALHPATKERCQSSKKRQYCLAAKRGVSEVLIRPKHRHSHVQSRPAKTPVASRTGAVPAAGHAERSEASWEVEGIWSVKHALKQRGVSTRERRRKPSCCDGAFTRFW